MTVREMISQSHTHIERLHGRYGVVCSSNMQCLQCACARDDFAITHTHICHNRAAAVMFGRGGISQKVNSISHCIW